MRCADRGGGSDDLLRVLMLWRLLEGQDVEPKYFVCGCPKHGLHLGAALVQGYVNRMPASIYNQNHWCGTFQFNSFAPVWQEMARWFFLASRLQQGYYYQGHVGYRRDVADFLRLSRASFVFIYRDLRDVAVSMAHHIMSADNVRNKHYGKAAYKCLGGYSDVLLACITGLGGFPGVVGLWELYASWLDEEWALCIRYEDALADLEGAAKSIAEYGLHRITDGIWEVPLRVDAAKMEATVKDMVALAQRTDLSPTFRRGQPGEWREVFTDVHREAFDTFGGNAWLDRLGYEVG